MVPVKHMACLRKFLREVIVVEFISEDIKFPLYEGGAHEVAGDVLGVPSSEAQGVGLYAAIFLKQKGFPLQSLTQTAIYAV